MKKTGIYKIFFVLVALKKKIEVLAWAVYQLEKLHPFWTPQNLCKFY